MANLVDKIPVVVDGESAYDFRLKVNQAISGVNTAFENINREYDTIVQATNDISRERDEVVQYVEEVVKPEIKKYFEDFMENGVEDIKTIQLRHNAPVVDSTGYLPDFWYQIIDDSGLLVTYAKLTSNSRAFSNLSLTQNSDWDVQSDGKWTIDATATYDEKLIPASFDKIELMLTLEDGSYIQTEEIENDDFTGIAPECTSWTGIQPEYDSYSKKICWNCGMVQNWNAITGTQITISDVKVTDGSYTQQFDITLTLNPLSTT